jgi:TrmH family RNA methyltransferase
MQIITSKDNEIIKNIKKLKEKKYRDERKEYIIEGIKLIEEAIEEEAKIKIIVEPKFMYQIAKNNCIYVSSKVFTSITDVKNPQGMLAVIEMENSEEKIKFDEDIIFVLDGIQDPGNLGTILRTIDSAGLTQVIVSKDTVDAYNPKVVRSTMGAIFRVNVIESKDLIRTMKNIKKHKYEILVTSLDTNQNIYDIDYDKKIIVIGNEANGVSKEVVNIADIKAKIPMLGKTESLNAAVATSIIAYEYVRRKISK